MPDARRMPAAAALAGAGMLAIAVGVAGAAPTEASFVDAAQTRSTLAAQPTRAMEFTEVSAGADFSLAVSEKGEVYAWGLNANGQLGIGSAGTNRDAPTRVVLPGDQRFVSASAGRQVGIALSESGAVYTWGNTVAAPSGATPSRVTGLPADVVGVSAGGQFFLAWTASGQLYSWGDNGSGRLGRGQANVASVVPGLVQAAGGGGGSISGASAGRFGATAWRSSGAVYAWGEGQGVLAGVTLAGVPAGAIREVDQGERTKMLLMESGALLYSRHSDAFVTQPGITDVADVSVAIADTNESQTYLVLTRAGVYHAWLDNSSGQYGDGTNTPASSGPRPIPSPVGESLTSVSAGDTHTLLLTGSGRILSTGSDQYGQLGNGASPGTWVLTPLPAITIWP